MLQAVELPLVKMGVLGVAALAGMLALAPSDHSRVQQLELHAPMQPNALYLTAWDRGDVYVRLSDGEMRPLVFQTHAFINDGCEWLATEHLVPESHNRYAYSYSEEILSCEPGATPALKTPRTGYVLVVNQSR